MKELKTYWVVMPGFETWEPYAVEAESPDAALQLLYALEGEFFRQHGYCAICEQAPALVRFVDDDGRAKLIRPGSKGVPELEPGFDEWLEGYKQSKRKRGM